MCASCGKKTDYFTTIQHKGMPYCGDCIETIRNNEAAERSLLNKLTPEEIELEMKKIAIRIYERHIKQKNARPKTHEEVRRQDIRIIYADIKREVRRRDKKGALNVVLKNSWSMII